MNIVQFTKKDGTTAYRTNVYLGVDTLTGKKVQTTATARTEKLCKIKAQQAINHFIKNGRTVAREKVTFENFEDLAMSWFDSYKLTVKANSIRVVNNFLKVYILPALGKYKAEKINSILLQEIVNRWAKNANTSEIKNGMREKGKSKDYKMLLNLIRRIFDYGMQIGAVDSNPAMQVRPPKLKVRTAPKIKHFEDDELKRFLAYLDNLEPNLQNEMNRTLYRFLLASGLRISEALALNWSDIDFKQKNVNVNKVTLQAGGIQHSTKTRESTRKVTLDDDTLRMLSSWKIKQNQTSKIISLSQKIIFSDKPDKVTPYNTTSARLKAHFKKAGVPNIGFHGFRHTHATLLMNNDVNPKEIQDRLGHSDYSITMNTYSHLAESKKRDTAEKFGAILKSL